MTPLERVARSIARMDAEFQYGTSCTDEDRATKEDDWPDYTANARAVLEAIREPSEDMLEAGRPSMPNGASDPTGSDQELSAAWQAMIDAALLEGKQ